MLNCNKRSITLNMKSAHGTEIFTELLKTSDVLVENFGPGVLDRLGFPWETIQQLNPASFMRPLKGLVCMVRTAISKPTSRLRRLWAER